MASNGRKVTVALDAESVARAREGLRADDESDAAVVERALAMARKPMASDRVVVSLATKSRGEDLVRLERSLNYAGFRGARLLWRPGEWPDGCPAHEDVPFAFKPFCLQEARKRGHGAALWVDAGAVVVGSLDPVFDQIEEHGYVLFANGRYRVGQWASDEALAALGLTREAALALREVNAAALGLRFSHPVARLFVDDWLTEARRGTAFRGTAGTYDSKVDFPALKWNAEGRASPDPRVSGHRCDQTVAGVVAGRLAMRLTATGLQSAAALRSVRRQTTIVKWRGREPFLGLRLDVVLVRIHQALLGSPVRTWYAASLRARVGAGSRLDPVREAAAE